MPVPFRRPGKTGPNRRPNRLGVLALAGGLAFLPSAAQAGSPGAIPVPAVPAALQVAATEQPILALRAQGAQVYECRPKKDDATQFAWVYTGPEADLFDSRGNKVGRHFPGPTWELADGSRVVGLVKASVSSPDSGAVPWLLVTAKDHAGRGLLSLVTSVQRLETSGGKAPAGGCSPANVGEKLRVPYTAVYYFYGLKP